MRIISILGLSLIASSCSLEQLQSQFSKKLNNSQFSVKCEARTEDQYYAKPDFAAMGFSEDAPYTEKYCSIFYEKKAWDGPFDSINWFLPITISTVSSPNPDGTPEATRPKLTIYNLNASGIRKGSVLMGILGQWTGGDVVMSFDQTVKIEAGGNVYPVSYLLSPIDDDYVSVPSAPNETPDETPNEAESPP